MRSWRSIGRWLERWRIWKINRKSSSSTKAGFTLNVNPVGRKAGESEILSNILLYDRCDICPLNIYIDVVCDNALEKLVISGKPSVEMLQDAKLRIITEFGELSGNTAMKNFTASSKTYYRQINIIKGLEIAHTLVHSGRIAPAIDFMKCIGISCNANMEAKVIKLLIERQITAKIIKVKEAHRLMKQADKGNNQGYSRKYFNRLLAALSICEAIHIQLDRNRMTVAEFAEYVNIYNEYSTHINTLKHGRKQ